MLDRRRASNHVNVIPSIPPDSAKSKMTPRLGGSAVVAATLLSPSPPPLLPHQPSPLPPPPLSPSPRHCPPNLFSNPPLGHPLHAHVVAPRCRRVIGRSLASHRTPLPLPSPVGCCLSLISTDGGSGAIICPFYSADLSFSPSSSLEKCVAGAAELGPPRRLSLRSRAASFDHPLRQAHVQLGRRVGWVGEHACLRSVRFPSRGATLLGWPNYGVDGRLN